MKKIIPLIFLFLSWSALSIGQEISSFQSEFAFGSTLLDSGVDIAYDSEGNIIVYGSFENDTDFDLSEGENIIDPLGTPDLFLAKYSSSGELIWVLNLGRIALTDGIYNGGMGIDSDDNILISGSFTSNINFNPLGDAEVISSAGGEDVFVASYSNDGQLSWINTIGGNSSESATCLALKSDNSIAIGIRFNGDLDVDPGDGEIILTNGGAADAAVVALDNNGEYLFSYQISTADNDGISSIEFAPDGKLAVGSTINGATSGFADRDMQLSYHQADGSLIWAYDFANYDDANEISDIAFAQDEMSLYIGGRINGTTDFNPDSETEELIDPQFADPFLAKYNLNGELEWARFVSSSGTNDYFAGVVEAGASVTIMGSFDVLATFVVGEFDTQKPSAGGQDVFIAAYDRISGDYIDANTYGGAGNEFPKKAIFSPDGTVLCTGSYSNTLNLNPDGEPLDNHGFTDVFFAEFEYQSNLSDNFSQSLLENLRVYPNPVATEINISIPGNISSPKLNYKLINVVGQEVKHGELKFGIANEKIDVSDLNKGVFILELMSGNQRISKRIVKQ